VNILFVNYGDFTTNSLNHISGFANVLCSRGHACVVAVPAGKETLSVIPQPLFVPATFAEVLARPGLFPDGRPADVIHAWTPREVVRKFVLAYQRLLTAPGRVIVHLEDNEEFLIERLRANRWLNCAPRVPRTRHAPGRRAAPSVAAPESPPRRRWGHGHRRKPAQVRGLL